MGGGQDPEMYREKIYVLILRERSERAPQKHTFQDSNTYAINAVSFNYLWYGAINDIILTKH